MRVNSKGFLFRMVVMNLVLLLVTVAGTTWAVELEVWSYSNQKIPDSVIKAYEASHPGVKINQRQPSGEFRLDGFLVAAAAGVPPALLHLNADFLPMYVKNDLVQPLKPWIDKGVFGNIDAYFPGVLDGVKYNGTYYFLPHRMSLNTLLYNRRMFEESGLNGDRPPGTWDDFKTIAKRLTIRDGGKTTRYGAALMVSTSTLTSWFQPTLWQAGGDILETRMMGNIPISTSEASRVAFNTDAGREALSFYANMVTEGVAVQGSANPFRDGQAAMLWQWYSTYVKQWREEGRDWVDVGPILSYRQKVGYGSLAGWVVPKGPQAEQAVDFLAFTLRPENVRQFLAETAFMPVRKDIGIDYFAPEHRGWAQKFINEVPFVRFDILHPEIRALQPMITVVLRRAVLGEISVGTALEEAERQANVYLKSAGY